MIIRILKAPVLGLMLFLPASAENLLFNGNAELPVTGNVDGYRIVDIPGWSKVGNATICTYSAPSSFPKKSSPGPPDRGEYFFSGGPENASSSISQTIDLEGYVQGIRAGDFSFAMSGYFGGWTTQPDNAVMTADFLDEDNNILSSQSIGRVTPQERNNISGLLLRSATGEIHRQTRSVRILVTFTRVNGMHYNDGYADNLHFELVPKPALQKPPVQIARTAEITSLSWNSQLGARYQVQTSSDLKIWKDLDEPLIGNDQPMMHSETTSEQIRFYRLDVSRVP